MRGRCGAFTCYPASSVEDAYDSVHVSPHLAASCCSALVAIGLAVLEGILLDARRQGAEEIKKRRYGAGTLNAVVLIAWGWQTSQVVAQVCICLCHVLTCRTAYCTASFHRWRV